MEYIEVSNSVGESRRLSRLVMGSDHLFELGWVHPSQSEPSKEKVFDVLDESARLGINLFDTSPIYVGGSESRLGEWRNTRRDRAARSDFYVNPRLNPDRDLYILSKGGFPYDLYQLKELPAGCHSQELVDELKKRGIADPNATDWSSQPLKLTNVQPGTYASHLYCKKDIMIQRISEERKKTCDNLHCDIDVYLMHRDDGDAVGFERVKREPTSVKNILDAVSSDEVIGGIFAYGWSNWDTHRVNETLKLANENAQDLKYPSFNSPYFSLFEMSGRSIHALGVQVTHDEMMDTNFQKSILIMPYSPLGGFSILDKPEPQWENAKRDAFEKFQAKDSYWQNVYPAIFTAENEARWQRVQSFAKNFNAKHDTNYTIDQFLNAYVLAHPRTDMLVIGALTVEQVRRTVSSIKLSKMLSPKDLEHLYSGTGLPT
jgi:aryl-alcohol dehydrogenase-like predicted oxidoreductase